MKIGVNYDLLVFTDSSLLQAVDIVKGEGGGVVSERGSQTQSCMYITVHYILICYNDIC